MAVRVCCPHCRTSCLVAEQHLGVPVQCGRCARTFTTRAEPADVSSVGRLDIAAGTLAKSRTDSNRERRFFVQHLMWSNSDQRHELAMLAIARSLAIPSICTALAPLLGSAVCGTGGGSTSILEILATALKKANGAAAVVVVWDGRAYVGQFGECRVQHHRGGRSLPIAGEIHLAVGDWLILSGVEVATQPLTRSAAEMAQRLAERAGDPVLVAHCH